MEVVKKKSRAPFGQEPIIPLLYFSITAQPTATKLQRGGKLCFHFCLRLMTFACRFVSLL